MAIIKQAKVNHYRHSLPLKSDSHCLVTAIHKVAHVVWQLQGLPYTSSNPPTFPGRPIPYTRCNRKRSIPEHEGALPSDCRVRWGRGYIRPHLHEWVGACNRFLDGHNSCGWSGRGPQWNIFCPIRGLAGIPRCFLTMKSRRRRSLLLRGRPFIGQESISCHIVAHHHLGSLVSASKESTNSTTTCLTAWASSWGSSIGMCSAQPWKTVSVDLSFADNSEPALIYQGSRLRASPSVNPGGKNPRCRTSRYDNRGPPIVNACLGS